MKGTSTSSFTCICPRPGDAVPPPPLDAEGGRCDPACSGCRQVKGLAGEPLGVKGLWPRVPAPLRVKVVVALARPFTWSAPVLVGGGVAVLAHAFAGAPGPWLGQWMLGVTCLILAAAGTNMMNAAADAEGDKLSKPYRPIPRGLVTPGQAAFAGITVWLSAFFLGVLLESGTFVFLLGLVFVGSVAYNMPPLRLKRVLFANYITIALTRGVLGVLAAAAVFTDPFQEPWLLLAAAAGLWNLGGAPTKDYGAAEEAADRAVGVRTLANSWPAEDAGVAMMSAMLLGAGLLFVGAIVGVAPVAFAVAAGVMGACAIYIGHNVARGGGVVNIVVENGRVWSSYYSGYAALGIAAWMAGLAGAGG